MATPPIKPDAEPVDSVQVAKPSARKPGMRRAAAPLAGDIPDEAGVFEDVTPLEEVEVLVDSGDWRSITVEPQEPKADGSVDEKARARRRLVSHLLDVQLSEHLMMLSGLGTSMCVVNDKGDRPAPTMRRLWDAVSKAAGASFKKVLADVKYPEGSEDIEVLLSRCNGYRDLQGDADLDAFIELAEKQIGDQCGAITDGPWPLPIHETFLRRLICRPTRLPRLQLFTTNYDLGWERAASNMKAVVIDGFTHADPQEFDPECFEYDVVRRGRDDAPQYIPNVFHLGKLHGSLDWKIVDGRIVKGRGERPVMIYPRNNKYQLSYNQPYLELMSRFQQALRAPNTGIIIAGFGFNDEHLAQPIKSAILSNHSTRIVVVDPGLKTADEKRPGGKHFRFLADLVRTGDKRIALVNATFEQYVRLMPEMSVVPEADAHRQRVAQADRR